MQLFDPVEVARCVVRVVFGLGGDDEDRHHGESFRRALAQVMLFVILIALGPLVLVLSGAGWLAGVRTLDPHDVPGELRSRVRRWSVLHGYLEVAVGVAWGALYTWFLVEFRGSPVWFDAVSWCVLAGLSAALTMIGDSTRELLELALGADSDR